MNGSVSKARHLFNRYVIVCELKHGPVPRASGGRSIATTRTTLALFSTLLLSMPCIVAAARGSGEPGAAPGVSHATGDRYVDEYLAGLDSRMCEDFQESHRKPTPDEIASAVTAHETWLKWLDAPEQESWTPDEFRQPHPGKRLEFRGADLRGANFADHDLRGANFRCADLRRATLRNANLGPVLGPINLGAGRSMFNSSFAGSDLRGANLEGARLTGAYMVLARFGVTGRIPRTVFIGTMGGYVEQKESDCTENEIASGLAPAWTKMKGALLTDASLKEAHFDPDFESLPDTITFAGAGELETLRSCSAPFALTVLREQLKKAGFVDQARALTYAIRHQERLNEDRVTSDAKYILFEAPCAWGMAPTRPLMILLAMIVVSAAFYGRALAPRSSGRLWLTYPVDSVDTFGRVVAPERLTLSWRNPITDNSLIGALFRLPRLLFIAVAFSVISAFSIGWHDFNVGSWLTRLWGREYVIRATGWARTVSGIQAVVSMYLLALWALVYFGSPFDY